MKELINAKAKGLRKSLVKFSGKINDFKLDNSSINSFTDFVSTQMRELSFDEVAKDKAGNLVGIIKGYGSKEAIVMVTHIDIMTPTEQKLAGVKEGGVDRFKPGIISSIYAGALVKRTMLPLTGDLIICCIPRFKSCDFGVKYLFDNYLKTKSKKVKGVILCEPTDFNINLGHKGRMEYEIIVKGRLNRNFVENRGMNMLGTMFPLINELEKVSKELPSDFKLGSSDLRIKDVRYNGYEASNEMNEFRIVVDRAFIPEETQGFILNKAKTLAKNVYKSEPDVMVHTILAKEKVKTYTGLELVSEKEFKPWSMESHQPFALESLKSLTENGFRSSFGYWQKIVTEGSYTYAQLKIPTIGFGAGVEGSIDPKADVLTTERLERAAYGKTLIVQRNIGIPTFGWSSDEI